MSDIKKKAQAMLVAEYKNLGIEPQSCALMAQGHQPGGVHHAAVQAIIDALTPPVGYVLVPVSPTDGMLDAMYTSLDLDGEVLKKMWNNAIAARAEGE